MQFSTQFSSLKLEGALRRYSQSFTEYLAHIPYSEVLNAIGWLGPSERSHVMLRDHW